MPPRVAWSHDGQNQNSARATFRTTSRFDNLGQLFPEAKSKANESDGPLAELVIADGADGRLDHYSLLEAALILGGDEDLATRRRYERQLAAAIPALKRATERSDNITAKAKIVHDYLHNQLFTGEYRSTASELRCVFERGEFNCVSATLLYCYLCEEMGIHCQIVQWKDHVACTVMTEHGPIAIETTCRDWFTAGRLVSSGRLTMQPVAVATQPKRPPRRLTSFASHQDKGRILTDVQLLALVDYNRGVACLHAKRYSEAMRASFAALRLDPENTAAWNNFLAAINNRALTLGSQRNYHAAIELLQRGQRVAPDYAAFVVNFRHIRQRWLQATSQAKLHGKPQGG